MRAARLMEIIGADFYTGVPDSQLRALCDTLMDRWGIDPRHHLIAANEGNCVGIAAGYHLATGRIPAVYLQNSGEGNILNPVVSLLNRHVYGIPMIFIIGWRGEPGVKDEPQHRYQGEITLRLLEDLEIDSFVIGPETEEAAAEAAMAGFREGLAAGRQAAFVIRRGALTDAPKVSYTNPWPMTREEILRHITRVSGEDPVICTTGKASRELFEIRTAAGESHRRDFLTVGSMGHSSSIALGAALQQPERRFWAIDGDGAALMHLGAMPVIAACRPRNLIHIVINNGAHETVGGMPTVMAGLDIAKAAKACGYPHAVTVTEAEGLDRELAAARDRGELSLIEIKSAIGARKDLGRPTTPAMENKENFMAFLAEEV